MVTSEHTSARGCWRPSNVPVEHVLRSIMYTEVSRAMFCDGTMPRKCERYVGLTDVMSVGLKSFIQEYVCHKRNFFNRQVRMFRWNTHTCLERRMRQRLLLLYFTTHCLSHLEWTPVRSTYEDYVRSRHSNPVLFSLQSALFVVESKVQSEQLATATRICFNDRIAVLACSLLIRKKSTWYLVILRSEFLSAR